MDVILLAEIDIAEWAIKVGIPAAGLSMGGAIVWLMKELRSTHREELARMEVSRQRSDEGWEKQIERLLTVNTENHERAKALVEAVKMKAARL